MQCCKPQVIALCCLALVAAPAAAQQATQQSGQPKSAQQDQQGRAVQVDTTYRSSTIVGMEVRNTKGEKLGTINDLVIDLHSNRIRYAALSVGGFLGLGDKLFAIPMDVMQFKYGEEERYFLLDADKQRLENAPGFDKDNWPTQGDPRWAQSDAYFASSRGQSHEGTVVSATDGKLTMTDAAGENQHSHQIGRDVKITLDGERANLEALKKGHHVKVTTVEKDGKPMVVGIEARSTQRTARQSDNQSTDK
jgi:sporulation protein YlmC with PRC-barrel domain